MEEEEIIMNNVKYWLISIIEFDKGTQQCVARVLFNEDEKDSAHAYYLRMVNHVTNKNIPWGISIPLLVEPE